MASLKQIANKYKIVLGVVASLFAIIPGAVAGVNYFDSTYVRKDLYTLALSQQELKVTQAIEQIHIQMIDNQIEQKTNQLEKLDNKKDSGTKLKSYEKRLYNSLERDLERLQNRKDKVLNENS